MSREDWEELRVEVDWKEIKNVEGYKYLGRIFGKEGGNSQEITNRIEEYG